jgi:hypothetical protein
LGVEFIVGTGSDDFTLAGGDGIEGNRGRGRRFWNLLGGGADKVNVCFEAGEEGGGGNAPNEVFVCFAGGLGKNPKERLDAGADGGGRAVKGVKLGRGRENARVSSSVNSLLGVPELLAGISNT